MKELTKEEFEKFAQQEFPNAPTHYEDGYCYIQAGSCLGEYLHYELHQGKIHLDIEGPNWRPIRNYLWSHVVDSRVSDSHWCRQGCRWTLDKDIESKDDAKQGFLQMRKIMEQHILKFEQLYSSQSIRPEPMLDSISANFCTIKELLETNLSIPEYQRPYRWNIKNVEQLLNDIYKNQSYGHNIYLIGTVIVHTQEDTLYLVDGQQRVTTLCLLLKALECKEKLPILKYNHVDSFAHVHENYLFIKNWLSSNIKDLASFKDYILCSCQVVRIVVKKLNEAFQMFESQNGRGKELEAYNLLKAFHIRAMSNDSKASKIEYDKQWESAALYCRDGYRNDLLKQLFNEQLFRTRKWARAEDAYEFSKKEIEEFKGVTITKDNQLDYAYQNVLVQQEIARQYMLAMNPRLFKIKNRFTYGDPDNINPFVSMTQLILNGSSFFDFVETYVEIYKRLFVYLSSSQLYEFKQFYIKHCQYPGYNRRKGDGYIREVYKSAIMYLFDRFGEPAVIQFYRDIYICLYNYRLTQKQVRYETMASKKNVAWIFQLISNSKSLSDLVVFTKASRFICSKIQNDMKYTVEEVLSVFK
jgi:hypothetical protein